MAENKELWAFPGLHYFEDDPVDHELFFGRKKEIRDLVEKVIAENISSLTFSYLDSDGAATGIAEDVRYVHIILTATNNDGSKTETLQTRIYARNLGI